MLNGWFFLFNPIKVLNDFLRFIVDVLGIKIIIILSSTMLLNTILIKDFQKETLGYSLYAGFCFFILILSINKKAFKQETQKEGSIE